MNSKNKKIEKAIRDQLKREAMRVHPEPGLDKIQKKIDKKKKEGK